MSTLPNLITDVPDWVERKVNEPPQPWLVNYLIPRKSLVLLSGKQKISGKTYAAIAMALTAALGRNTFEGFSSKDPHRILYIFEEGSERETAQRFQAIACAGEFELPDNQAIAHRTGIKLNKPHWIKSLAQAIEETSADLIVLDPFFRMVEGNENEQETVLAAIEPLMKLIDKYACSFLLLCHTRKSIKRSDDMDEVLRGSSVIASAYDGHVAIRNLKRPRDGTIPIPIETRFKDAPWKKGQLTWTFVWGGNEENKIPISAEPTIKWKSDE